MIRIVPEAAAQKRFYETILGLDHLSDNVLPGPEIENMVGLPAGWALNVRIRGRANSRLGQIEIIEYQGVAGADCYHRARPPAPGGLHVTFRVADNGALASNRLATRTSTPWPVSETSCPCIRHRGCESEPWRLTAEATLFDHAFQSLDY